MTALTQLVPSGTAGRRYGWLHDLGDAVSPDVRAGRVVARELFVDGAARGQACVPGSVAGEVEC